MKQITKWCLLVLVISTIGWILNVSVKKLNIQKSSKEKITLLPDLVLLRTDSVLLDKSFYQGKNVLFIHFNSECEHCHYEALDIKNNYRAFSNTAVVFMSSEPLVKINRFAKVVGLWDLEKVLFTQISSADAFKAFGNLSVPHIFIYGSNSVLKKEFKGETKVEAILKYLN